MPNVFCPWCDRLFYAKPYRLRNGRQAFCSPRCANRYHGERRTVPFWKRADTSAGPDGCWPRLGGRSKKGYGWYGRHQHAHRIAYALTRGSIPPGMDVLHSCDNPPCVNPAHLFLGTKLDNARDMVSKGRQARGDRHRARLHPETQPRGERVGGAKLTAEQVRTIRQYAAEGETFTDIAAKFRVDRGTVSMAVRRKTWAHVE